MFERDVEDVLFRAAREPLLPVEIVRGVRKQADAAAEPLLRLQVQAADVRVQSVGHRDDDRIRRRRIADDDVGDEAVLHHGPEDA